ncbi:helix-turn-helix domain-containing protein [Streptomyces sp. NBC_00503]|uniref:helix-turn-helix domain-containing protein n=1 Tax=Streptomyces sp. NBC_00503 TaxID=2903659 RepID=UPI002E805FB8|nr:helix-turn-helix domain-containing protein [Streptomyces sp. NBC_00503]WUD86387.1 TetR/AcrR family transcriptional regulator [Streptomyces sp. NBC_00503]
MKQERSRRTREIVLDAAAAEFSAHGYAHTTMNAVADRIGMTKGALYGHFTSKERLAEAIIGHGESMWTSTLTETAGRPPLPALGDLALELARRVHTDARTRAAFRLVADELAAGRERPNLLRDVRLHMTALAQSAQDRGEMTDRYPAASIVELLLAMVFAVQSGTWPAIGIHPVPWLESIWRMLQDVLRVEQPA